MNMEMTFARYDKLPDLLSVERSDASVAVRVVEGWWRAQAGLLEVLRFGALLLEVKRWLEDRERREEGMDMFKALATPPEQEGEQVDAGTRSSAKERVPNPGHGWNKGTGLKGWIEEWCPQIHYKTAYGYMTAAEGLRAAAKIAADVPLLGLMGEETISDKQAEKARQRVFSAINGGSLALLREAGRAASATERRGGAREGAKGRRALTPLEHTELARTEIRELLGKLGAYLDGAKPGMLTADERQWAATRMKDLAARLIGMNQEGR